MRPWILAPILTVLAVGLDGCTPPKTAAPPPPPPKLQAIERPDDLLGEVIVRDPLGLVEQVIQTPGSKAKDPTGILKEPDLAPIAEVVDLHGSAAFAMMGEPKHPDSWHGVGAVRLKDPKAARVRFAEAAGKGKFTVSESKVIRTKIYVSGKASIALLDEALVVGDSVATLESAGRWIGKETEGTPTHEIAFHVPLSRFAGQLKAEAKSLLDKKLAKDNEVTPLEPFMRQVVNLIGDLGDASLSLDLEKHDAVVDFKLGASGAFSTWLAKYPSATPRSILSLPRGAGAAVLRFPSSIAETVKSFFDGSLGGAGGKPPKEYEDARTFARSVGNEVALVYANKAKAQGEAPKTNEVLVRIELLDPAGARGAIKSLLADFIGKPNHKISRSPWSKFGADGESVQWVEPNEKIDARWAIKGNSLYVDLCDDGKVTLIEPALDPNNKTLLGNDLRAKSFADKLPKEGLAFAFYSQSSAAPKPEELGAVPGLDGIRWGWVSAGATGIASMWNVPLLDLADAMGKEQHL